MRVFLDANILLDVLVPRQDPNLALYAMKAISAARQLEMDLFIATITVPTLAYVMKGTAEEKKDNLKQFLKNITILDSPATDVKFAFRSNFKDIEDGMQYSCAISNNCDLIITRDMKDFKESEIMVMTPRQFLNVIEPD